MEHFPPPVRLTPWGRSPRTVSEWRNSSFGIFRSLSKGSFRDFLARVPCCPSSWFFPFADLLGLLESFLLRSQGYRGAARLLMFHSWSFGDLLLWKISAEHKVRLQGPVTTLNRKLSFSGRVFVEATFEV